ncbi:MAG: hypothetical protein R3179_01935, partial [Sedimenticolaceae bacterium]|nr:hypothetical protein [Sedimenticolaceae bacterium]
CAPSFAILWVLDGRQGIMPGLYAQSANQAVIITPDNRNPGFIGSCIRITRMTAREAGSGRLVAISPP